LASFKSPSALSKNLLKTSPPTIHFVNLYIRLRSVPRRAVIPRARVSCRSGGRRNTVGKAPLTIPNETIRLAEIASYISDSVQETGIDGLARTSLRFSSQGGP
jgi:hypothetical protein